MSATGRRGAARTFLVLAAVYGAFWVAFSAVSPTNFGGIDEWMILSLADRGALDVPYANRPLGLVFNRPAGFFPARMLEAAWLLHGHYIVAGGIALALALRRLAPDRPDLAFLAGLLGATFSPADSLRLDAVYSSAYAGSTAAVMAVLLLLLAAAERPILAVVAGGAAFLVTRVHEGSIPVLLALPAFPLVLGVRLRRGGIAFYLAAVGIAAAVAAVPFLRSRPETWYQGQVMGAYLDPAGLLGRLVSQYRWHLEPALRGPLPGPSARAMAMAIVVFAVTLLWCRRDVVDRRRLGLMAGLGLAMAGLGYSAFLVAARLAGPYRAQFLATPWIGLLLAALAVLLGSLLRGRAGPLLTAALGAWLAATAVVRTEALQAEWDQGGSYARHARAMRQVLALAPGLEPGTAVVLIDERRSWLGSFVFHHALDLAYGRDVFGCVREPREELFYACAYGPEGVAHQAWPVLQRAWGARSRSFAHHEVVVMRERGDGVVAIEEAWPAELGTLPPGAVYAPRARIRPRAAARPQRSVFAAVR